MPRDNKKLGLLERWASSGISFRSRRSDGTNSNSRNHQHFGTRTHSNSATSMTTSTSCDSLNIISAVSSTNKTAHNHQSRNSITIPFKASSIEEMTACRGSHHNYLSSTLTSSSGPLNIMHWMQNDCPKDVVPLVLAFAGPQKIVRIGRINHFWRQVIEQEATWRQLCESLYKWKEGDDIPSSWKKYYRYNPCVPVDYSSIHTALSEVIRKAKEDSSKPRAIRVLLRPGCYVLRKAITMDNNDDANHSVSVAIETMVYSPGNSYNGDLKYHFQPFLLPSDQPKRKIKNSLKNIFRCRIIDVESEDEEEFVNHDVRDDYLDYPSLSSEEILANGNNNEREGALFDTPSGAHGTNYERRIRNNRATLVLTTRRHNEPLLRVHQGSFTIRNIDLKHGSLGDDIWNGNSAIQVQPLLRLNGDSYNMPAPMVTLDSVDVTSYSGRGVVNIDGGHVKISNSYIHDCAATGIYVGGSGSRATIEQSDVIYNGKGNTRNSRGIAAGHSGIYLEQGRASIIDCNISRNTLTGISAISPDNALLSLQESDLVSNGTFQLEMPDVGTAAHRNSVTINNTLASSGKARSRSVFLVE